MRHLTKSLAGFGLLSALVVVGDSTSLGGDPIAVIALRPTGVPAVTPDPEATSAMFDSLIVAELTGAGYRVIPPEITTPAWMHVIDSLGGLFNPTTGEVIDEKRRAANVATLAALRLTHGADALLTAGVVMHLVPYDREGRARWDGANERVGVMEWSQARVLTLVVLTRDTAGRTIQCGRGGIRALQSADYWSGKKRTVKPAEFFSASGRNVAAVRRALASLIAHAPACDSSSGG